MKSILKLGLTTFTFLTIGLPNSHASDVTVSDGAIYAGVVEEALQTMLNADVSQTTVEKRLYDRALNVNPFGQEWLSVAFVLHKDGSHAFQCSLVYRKDVDDANAFTVTNCKSPTAILPVGSYGYGAISRSAILKVRKPLLVK